MTTLEVIVACVLPALLTFYFVARRYSERQRAGHLDWDGLSIFCFAVLAGVGWPLGLLWQIAVRPGRARADDTSG